MKLIALKSDRSSFKSLHFNRSGVSLIVGDGAKDEGSSNGVGKTLALGLVHHCLGAHKDKLLAKSIPDWRFSLTFELNGIQHVIERKGDGGGIRLDEERSSLKALRTWLDNEGPFQMQPDLPWLSFRSLFRRFARHRREDCVSPVTLHREQPHQALLYSLYLLGADVTLVHRKAKLRERLQDNNQLRKLARKSDPRLEQLLRMGPRPEVQLNSLQEEIMSLRRHLENMQIAEDYADVRAEADVLTQKIREIERRIAVINYQLIGIEKSMKQRPDIDRQHLLEFYRGLEAIFRTDALEHFENVESFHRSLAQKRRDRLNKDKIRLEQEQYELQTDLRKKTRLRDEKLRYLGGRHALDDYMAVTKRMVEKESDLQLLRRYLELHDRLERENIEFKTQMAKDDEKALSYLDTNPLAWADERFRKLIQRLYPNEQAGIVLTNNTGNNKLRYNLEVQAQGDRSDGINSTRILCFDWILFMHGAHHNIGQLWHDNRLFDHIDPRQRAAWFQYVLTEIKSTGKQYIASINTENYDSMLKYLDPTMRDLIHDSVIIQLRGDSPEHKLLGIQFGRS